MLNELTNVCKHYYLLAGTDDYKIIKSQRGKDLIMFHGYTYSLQYKGNNLYLCSTKLNKCKARLKIDKETKLLQLLNEEHIHPPPKYLISRSGEYIRV